MATLSPREIFTLARRAGFSPDREEAIIATAIALAESGGDPRAHNDNQATGDDSFGLWQINMIGDIGKERRQALGIRNEDLFKPPTNARAAHFIFTRETFTAWTTFKNDLHKAHLGAARQAAAEVAASGTTFSPEPEDDMNVDELLKALESPRGQAALRRALMTAPGKKPDAGSLFSKVADIQGGVDRVEPMVKDIKTKVQQPHP
jgi:hypothetical protein